jgi:ribosomal protein S18 acetylase RimI-like enzyme
VTRSALRVRPADENDLPALVELGTELREALVPLDGGLRPSSAAGRAALEQRFRDAIACADRELVLVVGEDEEPLGMALFTVSAVNALFDSPSLHMSHAVVDDRHRRRGAGRALVAAAASYAEERGIEQLVVSVRPGSRDANRFFARLGFAPLAVRRGASVVAVRRRLAQSDALTSVVRRRPRAVGALATVPSQAGSRDPDGEGPDV